MTYQRGKITVYILYKFASMGYGKKSSESEKEQILELKQWPLSVANIYVGDVGTLGLSFGRFPNTWARGDITGRRT